MLALGLMAAKDVPVQWTGSLPESIGARVKKQVLSNPRSGYRQNYAV